MSVIEAIYGNGGLRVLDPSKIDSNLITVKILNMEEVLSEEEENLLERLYVIERKANITRLKKCLDGFSVIFSTKSSKKIRSLDSDLKERMKNAIEELSNDPWENGTVKVKGMWMYEEKGLKITE